MISCFLQLRLGAYHGAPLGAHQDLVLGLLKIFHRHQTAPNTRGSQGRFVDQIGQIRPGKTWSAPRNDPSDPRQGPSAICAHARPRFSHAHVRSGLGTVTCRSKRPGRSSAGSKHIFAVCRRHDDYAFVGFKTVHLHQQAGSRVCSRSSLPPP